MNTRLRAWWDQRSPWRIAARAQARSADCLSQLIDCDREFTAYINWASVEIEARDLTTAEHASRLRVTQAAHARHLQDLLAAWEENAQALLERNRARNTAVQLEQHLDRLITLTSELIGIGNRVQLRVLEDQRGVVEDYVDRLDLAVIAATGRSILAKPPEARPEDPSVDFRVAS
ncbi:MAG: hypothetical protein Q7V58_09575 [Actinomycetota bacterium]|nr:hypothetical protein [Actinomycetota bacterium]